MQYYIAKTVSGTFPATVERVIESLKAEGFGVRFPGVSDTRRV
jgi:uncharacterized protein (DUF302 family)